MSGICNTPALAAERFLKMDIDSDKEGAWLFTNGDDVEWCAGFAMAACQQSGNWLCNSLPDFGAFRSIERMIAEADLRGLWAATPYMPPPSDNEDRWAGHLIVLAGRGHIGVATGFTRDSFSVIHGNSNNNSVSRGVWSKDIVAGVIYIPHGGWYD